MPSPPSPFLPPHLQSLPLMGKGDREAVDDELSQEPSKGATEQSEALGDSEVFPAAAAPASSLLIAD